MAFFTVLAMHGIIRAKPGFDKRKKRIEFPYDVGAFAPPKGQLNRALGQVDFAQVYKIWRLRYYE